MVDEDKKGSSEGGGELTRRRLRRRCAAAGVAAEADMARGETAPEERRAGDPMTTPARVVEGNPGVKPRAARGSPPRRRRAGTMLRRTPTRRLNVPRREVV